MCIWFRDDDVGVVVDVVVVPWRWGAVVVGIGSFVDVVQGLEKAEELQSFLRNSGEKRVFVKNNISKG